MSSASEPSFVFLRGGLTVPRVSLELALDLERRGFSMRREGSDLLVEPGRSLTEEDRAQIRRWNTHVLALLEYEARRHRIVITRHFQNGLPLLNTDVAQFQQVILNILHNAMDAIGQDGAIEVTSRSDGDHIVVDFADSGPGLSAEVMAHLYDPFFTTKPKGKGTGLGMYVSRDIMARLGGELTGTNRASGGAVFSVRLPLVAQIREERSNV